MKKNWFLTKNNSIINLNIFVGFGFFKGEVRGFLENGEVLIIYSNISEEIAKEYLKEIYNQLWDENYRGEEYEKRTT